MRRLADPRDWSVAETLLEVTRQVLSRAADPETLGDFAAKKSRELSGAETAVVVQSQPEAPGGTTRIIGRSSARDAPSGETKEILRLGEICGGLKSVQLWNHGGDGGEAERLLTELGYGLSMAVPLRAGRFGVGSLLLLGVPDGAHAPWVAEVLEGVSAIAALGLRGALLSSEQEARLARHTEQIKASEERYALAQRAANIGSWDWNILTGELCWSERIEPLFGFARGAFDGTYEAFLECVHPEDRASVSESVDGAIKRGNDYSIEHRIVRADGTVRWVSETGDVFRDEHGKAVRMLGVVQDITERKRAEAALQRELKLNRVLAQLSADLTSPSATVEAIADTILEHAQALTGSEDGFASVIDPHTGDNTCHTLMRLRESCRVENAPGEIVFRRGTDGRYPGLWGHALNTREAFYTNAPESHESAAGAPPGHIRLKNFLSVPALIAGELVGQIAVANRESDYTDEQLSAVAQLAHLLALAVDRVQRKEALQTSEALLNETQAITRVGGWEYDVIAKRVTWTDEVYRIYGLTRDYDPNDITRDMSFYTPDSLSTLERAFERAVERGEPYDLELEFIRADGARIWVRTIGKPVLDDGKVIRITGNFMDITDRKRAEEELRNSLQASADIVRSIPSGLFLYEYRPPDSLTLLDANPEARRLTGLDVAAHVGKEFDVIWPEARARGLTQQLLETARTGKTYESEEFAYEDRKLVGVYRIRAFSMPANRLGVAFEDITSRKQAEEALQTILEGTAAVTGEEFFRSLVRCLATAFGARYAVIAELRGSERARTLAVWANEAFGENFEYDLAGTPCEQVANQRTCFYPRGVQRSFPYDRLLVTMGVESYLGTPLVDGAGGTRGLLVVMDDRPMEETPLVMHLLSVFAARAGAELGRKHAEEEQQKLESQLRQSQKMEAIGQLAGGVAHDFNNILTAILGNAELAVDHLHEVEPVDYALLDRIQQIEQSAERASDLTRQLLAFSRRQVFQPAILNLNRTLTEMERMLRRLITEDIELTTRLAPDLRPVRADAGQIEQVILNLVVNARDAMIDGGKLTVSTENVLLDDRYARTHTDATPGPHVALMISDTGCGMDEATRERVFEPFFTTKAVGQGTGLGLATVYGIVRQAGGHVTVHSETERGTTFAVYLPAAETPVKLDRDRQAEAETPTGTETVLVCEDDASVRYLAERILTSGGYTVLAADSGAQALELVDAFRGAIDLLVTDVIMPDMNGRRLAESLAHRRPGLKTLYVSGYTSDIIAHHGVLDEGVEFLEKPFSREGFLRRVRAVLDSRGDASEVP